MEILHVPVICHIEKYIDGNWVMAATFEADPQALDRGVHGSGWFQYDIDYAATYLGDKMAELIPGLTVNFELFRHEFWPPMLVDLLPGGAGRQAWVRRMQVQK